MTDYWSEENQERIRAARRARRAANPEATSAARKAQRIRDLAVPGRMEARREKNAEYMRSTYGMRRDSVRAYNIANSAKIVAAVAEWRMRNPEAVARHASNRRARKGGSGEVLSPGLSEKLFELQGGRCACCGKKLGKKYHLDHIVPLALGGRNDDSNIQLLTPKCNAIKGAKDPIDYMQERGFLL